MPLIKNLVGKRFGRLSVINMTDQRRHRNVVWRCLCDCGNYKYTTGILLKSGNTSSCGCLSKEILIANNKKRSIGIEERRRRGKIYRELTKDHIVKHRKEYTEKNIEVIKARRKKYYEENKERLKDRLKESSKKSYLKHKQKRLAGSQKWRKKNADRCRLLHRQAEVARRRKSEKVRLSHVMSSAIQRGIKGIKNGKHWELLVPYSLEDLMKHLEYKFKPGMSWENYGEWHIDHVIPISLFNYESYNDLDFKRCWALNNLQPLWKKENISKSNRIEQHFQPCLNLKVSNER
jgi:hypothetical protein